MNRAEISINYSFLREVVRTFMRETLPAEICVKSLALRPHKNEQLVAWPRILHHQGWGTPAWPWERSETDWSVIQQKMLEEESVLANAPRHVPQNDLVGTVIQQFGTPAQQQRFLPRPITLEDWYCQGYSETGVVSDRASPRHRAPREGDRYIDSSENVWTSTAPWADWIFALVRTSDAGRPNEDISFLLIGMHESGIQSRWFKRIDGGGTLAQVLLADVQVPVERLVHEENTGWAAAQYDLGNERHGHAAIGNHIVLLHQFKRISNRSDHRGKRPVDQNSLRKSVDAVELDLLAHEWTLMPLLSKKAEAPAYFMAKSGGGGAFRRQSFPVCAGHRLYFSMTAQSQHSCRYHRGSKQPLRQSAAAPNHFPALDHYL